MNASESPPRPKFKRRKWLLFSGILLVIGLGVWAAARWVFVPRLTFVEIREEYGKRLAIFRITNWSMRTIGYYRRKLGYSDTTFRLLKETGWETKAPRCGKISGRSRPPYQIEPWESGEIAVLLVCEDQTKVDVPFQAGIWFWSGAQKNLGKVPNSIRRWLPVEWQKTTEIQLWSQTIHP